VDFHLNSLFDFFILFLDVLAGILFAFFINKLLEDREIKKKYNKILNLVSKKIDDDCKYFDNNLIKLNDIVENINLLLKNKNNLNKNSRQLKFLLDFNYCINLNTLPDNFLTDVSLYKMKFNEFRNIFHYVQVYNNYTKKINSNINQINLLHQQILCCETLNYNQLKYFLFLNINLINVLQEFKKEVNIK